MSNSTTAANQALDGLGGTVSATNLLAYVSLHVGAPGTVGASETTGSGYARQACSWNAAGSRFKTNSSSLTFSTSGFPITDAGTFSAVTGGTFGISLGLTSVVAGLTITFAPASLVLGA